MKAVILAAGKGTRMRELTESLPKPMLKVQDKPILQHIVEGLRETGIREFCIITGYRADVVEGFFGDGSQFDVAITYARQEVQDGTGKAPELAKEFVGADPFILTYGDILVKPETYAAIVDRFNGDLGGVVTVTRGEEISKGGFFLFDDAFLLDTLVEKPSAEDIAALEKAGKYTPGDPLWYNAGIYAFSPALFTYTAQLEKSPRGEYELTDAILGMLAGGHHLAGVEIEGRWVDVRDPETLEQLENES
jgi:dTDP-glucose pyrophosphorylase